jgi:hypothetical protein
MNRDIVGITQGEDMRLYPTETSRAGNILSVQLDSLEYAPDLGIDLDYFIDTDFRFQNESFKAYLVQVLAQNGINVTSVSEVIHDLYNTLTMSVGDSGAGQEGFVV